MTQSYSWCKRDSKPLSDPTFCRLGWAVRGFYDALYMLQVDIMRNGGNHGNLGTAEDIAWALRADAEFTQQALTALQNAGYLNEAAGYWSLARFENEQTTVTAAERVRLHRVRNADETRVKRDCNVDVTQMKRDCNDTLPEKEKEKEIESEIESESEEESEKESTSSSITIANIAKYYENNFNLVTSGVSEQIKELEKDYTADWVLDAMKTAVNQNKRSLAYVGGILKRWERDGRGDKRDTHTLDVLRIDPATGRVL